MSRDKAIVWPTALKEEQHWSGRKVILEAQRKPYNLCLNFLIYKV